MKEDAPLVHRSGNLLAHKHVSRGNAKEAIANAKYVYTEEFHTPWTEHAFLEPECAIGMPYEDGVLIYSTDQGTYATQHECAEMLGLPNEKVRVVNKLVGGGFGGKGKGSRGGNSNRRSNDNRRDRGGRRDQFKKGRKDERFDKENRYRKDHKKPRNTSSEKKTGFVIRTKGDK